jgi:hypothetical protein
MSANRNEPPAPADTWRSILTGFMEADKKFLREQKTPPDLSGNHKQEIET